MGKVNMAKEQIEKAQADWNSQVMVITPDYAKSLLAKNTGNRRIRKSSVSRYASDMKKGEWQLTPQGVIIGKSGVLLDGQHRLHAVIESDVSVPMMVTFGVDAESALGAMLDVGTKRGAADIMGVPTSHASTTNSLMQILMGYGQVAITAADTQTVYVSFPEIAEASEWYIKNNKFMRTAAFTAAATLAMIGGVDKDYVHRKFVNIQLGKFDKFSKADAAFYRHYSQNKTLNNKTQRRDTLSKSLNVFDPSREDVSQCVNNVKLFEKYKSIFEKELKERDVNFG